MYFLIIRGDKGITIEPHTNSWMVKRLALPDNGTTIIQRTLTTGNGLSGKKDEDEEGKMRKRRQRKRIKTMVGRELN